MWDCFFRDPGSWLFFCSTPYPLLTNEKADVLKKGTSTSRTSIPGSEVLLYPEKKITTIIGNSSVARQRRFDTFFTPIAIPVEIVIGAAMFKVKKRVAGVVLLRLRYTGWEKKLPFNRSHKYHQFKQVICRRKLADLVFTLYC